MVNSLITACLLSILLGAEPPAQSPAATSDRAPGIAWLVFVDDLHLDFRNTGLVRQFLRGLSRTLMTEHDAIVMRTSGPSSITLDATSDRSVVEATIRRVSGAGLPPRDVIELIKDPTGEIDTRLAATFSAVGPLLDLVPATRDRRRALLYISNGYDSERGRALASLFARAAQQAQVMVFTVNGAALGPPRDSAGVDADVWREILGSRRQSLRAIAEPTGGSAFLDDADAADATSRIRAAVLTIK